MFSRSIKIVLVAVLAFVLWVPSHTANAQETKAAPAETKAVQKDAKVDPAEIIMAHVKDAHEFHFFSVGSFDAVIYLPVILYAPEKGFTCFSASRFGKEGEEEYKGYRIDKAQKISAVDGSKVYDFSMTRNVVQMLLSLIIMVVLFVGIAKKYSSGQGVVSAPKGWQNLMEPVVTFVIDEVAKPNLGKRYRNYLPYLLTVFFFILINSLFGLIPGSANVTGNTAFTLVLGVISAIIILASTNKHFWGHLFWPPGIPFLVKVILVPVELAGVLLLKPAALIIRLFANMVAGHVIILSFISLIFIFGGMNRFVGWGFAPFSILFTVFVYFIEILVVFIQAFIFTNLTAVFIGLSMEGSHDTHEHGHEEAVISI
jgi:F-type H+-transporting ATPase subunit a